MPIDSGTIEPHEISKQGSAVVFDCRFSLADSEEGRFVASSIFEAKYNLQLRNDEFAVLYRTNAQSRSIEDALRRKNIPFQIFGGLSFYQRKVQKYKSSS